MTIRFFIALLICIITLPVYAKDIQVEQIKQDVFKNVKNQISTIGFPQNDPKRVENLYALQTMPIVDDRTVIRIDREHYMLSFNSEQNYNKSYIYNFNGTLAFVDFIIYPSHIKSYEDYKTQTENENKVYPYYVYRHYNNGFFNGVWYISNSFAYFFDASKNLRYKCNEINCTDVATGNSTGLRYYY